MHGVWNVIRHEPAVSIGLTITICMSIQSGIEDGSLKQWRDLVPLVTGVFIRFFVTPAVILHQVRRGKGKIVVELEDVLIHAFLQNYHADRMNAQIHCAPVRFSPLTFRLAEQIERRVNIIPGGSSHPEVWMVLNHVGKYEEDKGR